MVKYLKRNLKNGLKVVISYKYFSLSSNGEVFYGEKLKKDWQISLPAQLPFLLTWT